MAGIGFELKKMYSNKNTSYDNIKAIFVSSLVSAGPWLITVGTLIILDIISEKYIPSRSEKNYFMVTLTYVFVFSQIFSGSIQHYMNRYLSDCIFEKKYAELKASYPEILELLIVVCSISGIVFIKDSTLPDFYNYSIVGLFVILTATWVTMNYVSVLKNYLYIAKSYFLGSTLSLILGVYFITEQPISYIRQFPPFAILLAYVLGMGLTFFMLSAYISIVFRYEESEDFDLIDVFKKYSNLSYMGVLYTLGMWGHLFIYWYGQDSYAIGNIFRLAPFYSTTIFYAFFVTIPTIVYFYVFMETNFYKLYRNYYGTLNCNGSYERVEAGKKLMINGLYRELYYSLKLQLLICISVALLAEDIFAIMKVSLYEANTFRIMLFAAFCALFVGIYMILLLYFDFRKKALDVSLVFAIFATGLEYIAYLNGSLYTGLGFFLGSFIALVYADYVLEKALETINYETFYRQNFIDEKPTKFILFIKEMLRKRVHLVILSIIVILFLK